MRHYEVVWSDPSRLKLKAPRQYGVRRSDLLSPVEEQVIEADVKSYNDWVTQRAELIERGSQPSLSARTATEVAATKEGSRRDRAPVAALRRGDRDCTGFASSRRAALRRSGA
ncbi:MAG: hypothetical protein DMG27_22175, partial [Acidobacteria bacterium]